MVSAKSVIQHTDQKADKPADGLEIGPVDDVPAISHAADQTCTVQHRQVHRCRVLLLAKLLTDAPRGDPIWSGGDEQSENGNAPGVRQGGEGLDRFVCIHIS